MPKICTLAEVGRASHWSAGPPAAEMSAYVTRGMPWLNDVGICSAHGKWMPLACTQ